MIGLSWFGLADSSSLPPAAADSQAQPEPNCPNASALSCYLKADKRRPNSLVSRLRQRVLPVHRRRRG